MDFIDCRALQTPRKTGRIVLGKSPELVVIQRNEHAAIIGDSTSERRLAGLAWPDECDNSGVRERETHRCFGVPLHEA